MKHLVCISSRFFNLSEALCDIWSCEDQYEYILLIYLRLHILQL